MQSDFDAVLLQAVDEALSSFGEDTKQAIYMHLENFNVKKSEIPRKVEAFAKVLGELLGPEARGLEIHIVKRLYEKIEITFDQEFKFAFCDYIERARLQLYAKFVNCICSGLAVFYLDNINDFCSFKLIAINLAAASIMGMTVDEALGKTIIDVYPKAQEIGLPKILVDVIHLGKTRNLGKIYYQRKSESVFSVIVFPLSSDCIGLGFKRIAGHKTSEEKPRKEGKVPLQDDKLGPGEWILDLDPEGRHIWPYSLPDVTATRMRYKEKSVSESST